MNKKENRKFKDWITELPELPIELTKQDKLIPKETKKKRGRPEKIIPAVLDIIKEYPMAVTVRQIFYRLVAKKILNNTTSGYSSLDQALTRARWEGRIPFHRIIDRTRSFIGGESYNTTFAEGGFIPLDEAEHLCIKLKRFVLVVYVDARKVDSRRLGPFNLEAAIAGRCAAMVPCG